LPPKKDVRADIASQSQAHATYHPPLGHRFSNLHREQQPVAELLNATLQQRNESVSDLGAGGASAMAPLQHGGNQLLELKGVSVYSSKSDNPLAGKSPTPQSMASPLLLADLSP